MKTYLVRTDADVDERAFKHALSEFADTYIKEQGVESFMLQVQSED